MRGAKAGGAIDIESLLAFPTIEAQKSYLKDHFAEADGRLAPALKAKADFFLRSDIQKSFQMADLLLYFSEISGDSYSKALGLLAKANAYTLGLAQHQTAIDLYEQAAEIYSQDSDSLKQAQSQIGKLFALLNLGRYDEAITTAAWAAAVFEKHEDWFLLAKLTVNTGVIYGRSGNDVQALRHFDKARRLYQQIGAGDEFVAGVDYDRAIVLRSLGRLQDSVEASLGAIELLSDTGLTMDLARARQSLALTYFLQGRYNEALRLLDAAKEVFLADGRNRDAVLADVFMSDCLLLLQQFEQVIEKTVELEEVFSTLETNVELARVYLNAGSAHAGLKNFDAALGHANQAQQIYFRDGNERGEALARLLEANIRIERGEYAAGEKLALKTIKTFRSLDLWHRVVEAQLAAAKAAIRLNKPVIARGHLNRSADVLEQMDAPSLQYQANELLGVLAEQQGFYEQALQYFESAIREMEKLRGWIMLEYRSGFLANRTNFYDRAIWLSLELGRVRAALDILERSKSRALIEMLAFRIRVYPRARSERDKPLMRDLERLRKERDGVYSRWLGDEQTWALGQLSAEENQEDIIRAQLAIEDQITELWHRLLIRNADYAEDASLWRVGVEPVEPLLAPGTVVLEYALIEDELIVFLISNDELSVERWPLSASHLGQQLLFLQLNLLLVSGPATSDQKNLRQNVDRILQKLYGLLIEPIRRKLNRATSLIIVPSGNLHYLPFHALFDGKQYLVEKFEFSYLPAGSLLRYCVEKHSSGKSSLAVGHSAGGRLPYAVMEADLVAELFGGRSLLEGKATRASFAEEASDYQVLHLATHGEYRGDNPLFSGITLADGLLTTLDIFGLDLQASLVTLSGCETGKNVIQGGDELLGLMRAFIQAGAASVLLSHWPIEDRSTQQFMELFYRSLIQGKTKSESLQRAQRVFIEQQNQADTDPNFSHPFYWAAFFLVGDPGPLPGGSS